MDGSSHASLTTETAPATGEPLPLDAVRTSIAPAPATWSARLVHPACVSIAAACHLALLAVLLPSAPEAYGEGGTALEAIAVDVVDDITSTAAPSIVASAPSPAADVSEPLVETPPVETAALPEPERPQPVPPEPVQPEPVLQEPALLPEPPKPVEEPPPEKLEVVEPDQKTPAPKEATPQPPPSPAQAGSVATAATGEASPGVVNAYGARIARLISQTRPRTNGLFRKKGRVVIAFAIEPDGRVGAIEIRKTSGHTELDQRAVEALQKIAFPAPAPEMSARQRNFLVPYEFR